MSHLPPPPDDARTAPAADAGSPDASSEDLRGPLLRYRTMASVVGVLLVVLILVGVPLKYLAPDETSAQHLGEWITSYLGVAHGWLYMIFLVAAALLARAARWSIGFTIVTLLSGTVPLVSFWAERRATAHTRAGAAHR